MDAAGELDLGGARVNERGSGSEQYPPRTLLALPFGGLRALSLSKRLIDSYATGVFSSRQIERSTHDSVPVRLLCADTHPDHETICTFRRAHRELRARSFAQVLELSARGGVLKVGGITVALDGTKVLASASKHSAVSHGRGSPTHQPPYSPPPPRRAS